MLRESGDVPMREQDRLAGLTVGHTQAFESGRQGRLVSARIVAQLARLYGATMDWLYLGIGQPPMPHVIEANIELAWARLDDVEDEIHAIRSKMKPTW